MKSQSGSVACGDKPQAASWKVRFRRSAVSITPRNRPPAQVKSSTSSAPICHGTNCISPAPGPYGTRKETLNAPKQIDLTHKSVHRFESALEAIQLH
ncbi:hypothetical protein BaRGS_00033925 [Batillaria attramentaria]|uniref:Uncharacterized protein n=1 Tax=Batillaria attramentaria TaxID=370345 RepID=A0ABD0JJC1_9CAEN